jgi:hypothetical protein
VQKNQRAGDVDHVGSYVWLGSIESCEDREKVVTGFNENWRLGTPVALFMDQTQNERHTPKARTCELNSFSAKF